MSDEKIADPAELQKLLEPFLYAEIRATYPAIHFGGNNVHPLYVSADGPMVLKVPGVIDKNDPKAIRAYALEQFEAMLAALRAEDWVNTRAPVLELGGTIINAVWTFGGRLAYPDQTLASATVSLELTRAQGKEWSAQ